MNKNIYLSSFYISKIYAQLGNIKEAEVFAKKSLESLKWESGFSIEKYNEN